MLLFEMDELVAWVYLEIERKGFDLDMHHDLFHATATKFNLYDDSARAPVEGIMRDYNENGMTAKNHEA